jgi:hypothetical protein
MRFPEIDANATTSLGPFPMTRCAHCGGVLRYFNERAWDSPDFQPVDAIQCVRCLWWLCVWTKQKTFPSEWVRNVVWEATVTPFDYMTGEVPLIELRRQLTEGEVDLRNMSASQLERIVTSVFSDALGCRAIHVGRSGDGGIDVLVLDREPPLALQVKRRASGGTEGPAVVRDLIGALAYRSWRRGAIITTADSFSRNASATAAAEPLMRDGYEIDLYTYDALREIVRATQPSERPWRGLAPGLKSKDNEADKTNTATHPSQAADFDLSDLELSELRAALASIHDELIQALEHDIKMKPLWRLTSE